MDNLKQNHPELFYTEKEDQECTKESFENIQIDLNNIQEKVISSVVIEDNDCPILSISLENVDFTRLVEELIGVLGYEDLMVLIRQVAS